MGSGWSFRAKHIEGVENVLADGISRWENHASISSDLHRLHPSVPWREQVLSR